MLQRRCCCAKSEVRSTVRLQLIEEADSVGFSRNHALQLGFRDLFVRLVSWAFSGRMLLLPADFCILGLNNVQFSESQGPSLMTTSDCSRVVAWVAWASLPKFPSVKGRPLSVVLFSGSADPHADSDGTAGGCQSDLVGCCSRRDGSVWTLPMLVTPCLFHEMGRNEPLPFAPMAMNFLSMLT